ncbi:hypothetical protein DFH09DRAFT_1360433 [Mycena vulgaris]|nr:hypothetical protein DFH09DRAFT_1360433 [Mycena vulgaris]
MPTPVDLKQVGKLFKDTLAAMRGDGLDVKELEPQAIASLKAARCKIMLQIKDAFYPAYPLYAFTVSDPVPVVLRQYQDAFRNNIAALMLECAFESCTTAYTLNAILCVTITFPAPPPRIAAPQTPDAPQTLDVDDEFSRMAGGANRAARSHSVGAFAATDFARLLGTARGQGQGAGGSGSGATKKRRASGKIKDENDLIEIKDDSEDEAEGPRLRSMTRATSTATLRSTVGDVRRSARKRVKGEE